MAAFDRNYGYVLYAGAKIGAVRRGDGRREALERRSARFKIPPRTREVVGGCGCFIGSLARAREGVEEYLLLNTSIIRRKSCETPGGQEQEDEKNEEK